MFDDLPEVICERVRVEFDKQDPAVPRCVRERRAFRAAGVTVTRGEAEDGRVIRGFQTGSTWLAAVPRRR